MTNLTSPLKRVKRLGDIIAPTTQQNLTLKNVMRGLKMKMNSGLCSLKEAYTEPIDEVSSIEQMEENLHSLKASQQYDDQNFLQYTRFLNFIKNQILALNSMFSTQNVSMENMKNQAKMYERAGQQI